MVSITMMQEPADGQISVVTILITFLGLGVVAFGVLTVYFYSQAQTATNTLNQQKQAAAKAAATAQQKTDAKAALLSSETPYRSYTAPKAFGSFVINFPKNWNASVQEAANDTTQVNLLLNPDFIRQTGSTPEPDAAHIRLLNQSSNQLMQTYTFQVKEGKLKQQAITVSGINAIQLTGSFSGEPTLELVLVPVRDKTISLAMENAQYQNEFNQILAQAKVNP